MDQNKVSPSLTGRRKTIQVLTNHSVVKSPLSGKHEKGMIMSPAGDSLAAVDWVRTHVDEVNELLLEKGALLLRGFQIKDPAEFRTFVEAYSGPPLGYTYRSTPRGTILEGVFTSTEYPKELSIPQHNEMSYTLSWPSRLFFYCVVEPGSQGQTPIADSARVYRRIPPSIRDRFEKQGVRYVRNYGRRFDLSWQHVFQTEDPKVVEDYCLKNKIEFEWSESGLKTSQTCQATIQDPRTGEKIWFNQAHLFHISSLPEDTRKELEIGFESSELPRNAYFGDGSEIPIEDLKVIRAAYREEEIIFDWKNGDIMILDNVLMSHGRNPYTPPRKILIAMT